ncbi:TPA: hypothetical protein DCL30_00930 [Candidatus Peribacteria bacterium]|nr:MAG: hypothetical protein A3J91_02820 [Candidatus Peribacteria bacterium RIFOXYC2_FULL_58_10]OGJ85169.1 MAG: hypothetical protein A2529_01760 [Candidatus Peribacteria bacterium RIFOXYD2_FULL_58_15]HAI98093.1 hypothetical protein [Candidatus Peribacteria bacterium]HAS33865.1 hypothetical protein [Candidatus Peribacteria bacterium]
MLMTRTTSLLGITVALTIVLGCIVTHTSAHTASILDTLEDARQNLDDAKVAYQEAKNTLKGVKVNVKEMKAAVKAAKQSLKSAQKAQKQADKAYKTAQKKSLRATSPDERAHFIEIMNEADAQRTDAGNRIEEATAVIARATENLAEATENLTEAQNALAQAAVGVKEAREIYQALAAAPPSDDTPITVAPPGSRLLTPKEIEFFAFFFASATVEQPTGPDADVVASLAEYLKTILLWDVRQAATAAHPPPFAGVAKDIIFGKTGVNYGGLSLKENIYLRSLNLPAQVTDVPLIGHELWHTIQGRPYTLDQWAAEYLEKYLLVGYRASSFEIEAYAMQAAIEGKYRSLFNNPPHAGDANYGKIAQGIHDAYVKAKVTLTKQYGS